MQKEETERRWTDDKNSRITWRGRPGGIAEERIIPPAHKSFLLFPSLLTTPLTPLPHCRSRACQIPESHLERRIIAPVKVTICDILLRTEPDFCFLSPAGTQAVTCSLRVWVQIPTIAPGCVISAVVCRSVVGLIGLTETCPSEDIGLYFLDRWRTNEGLD